MNNIKDIIEKEYSSSNESYKITKVYEVKKNESKDIYAYIIGSSTLSTFNYLLNSNDLNIAVNNAIEEVRGNSRFINLMETFTPRVWQSITSAAVGLKGYVQQDLESKQYGPIDFLNIGTTSRGI